MKNVIFTSPILLYSWVPILACACICCVINENLNFTQKMHKRLRKKETSQIKHPVFRIFVWQFAVQRNENILTKIVQNKLFLQK